MNAIFDKARAKRQARQGRHERQARHTRQAMIDSAVRALPKRDLEHIRGAINSPRPELSGICEECLRIVVDVRANYRKLYAEVYK